MSGGGGPRHKASLDTDLYTKSLLITNIWCRTWVPRSVGTSSAPNIKGLVRNMDLWMALGKLSSRSGSSTTQAGTAHLGKDCSKAVHGRLPPLAEWLKVIQSTSVLPLEKGRGQNLTLRKEAK